MGVFMFINVGVSSIRAFPYVMRRFSLSSAPDMNKYLAREAKFLNRFISSTKKKRKYFICETPTPSSGGAINFGKEFRTSKENNRRIAVLNKLFIKGISDLLSTGSFSGSVMDKGLEISRVSITSNFNQVNVFWTTNNEKNLEALEAVLPSIGFTLRHELSQLRVMGNVPRITFVKDKHHTSALEVDHLLQIADYGDDHEPSETDSDFKHSQEPQVNIIKRTQENGVNTDSESDSEIQQSDVELMPIMRQDTFNLDHERMLKKIMKSMYKTRAIHRFEPNLAITGEGTEYNFAENNVDNMTREERKEALSKFILQRRLLKEKLEKLHRKKYNSELNVPIYENNKGENEYDYEEFHTEDFIDEDSFEDKTFNN